MTVKILANFQLLVKPIQTLMFVLHFRSVKHCSLNKWNYPKAKSCWCIFNPYWYGRWWYCKRFVLILYWVHFVVTHRKEISIAIHTILHKHYIFAKLTTTFKRKMLSVVIFLLFQRIKLLESLKLLRRCWNKTRISR